MTTILFMVQDLSFLPLYGQCLLCDCDTSEICMWKKNDLLVSWKERPRTHQPVQFLVNVGCWMVGVDCSTLLDRWGNWGSYKWNHLADDIVGDGGAYTGTLAFSLQSLSCNSFLKKQQKEFMLNICVEESWHCKAGVGQLFCKNKQTTR